MHLKRKDAAELMKRASDNFSRYGVGDFIASELIDGYRELLQIIANESKYQEGERIKPSDLEHINYILDDFHKIIRKAMVDKCSKLDDVKRVNYDAFSPMIAANDYFFAMAMDILGCPDIPPHFGKKNVGTLGALTTQAEYMAKREDFDKVTAENYFNEQRGRSAHTVRSMNFDRKLAIQSGKGTMLTVAKYAAEYQALRRRQDEHNFIWKLLHWNENAERNKLLEEMRSVLYNAVEYKKINLEKELPAYIADSCNRPIIEAMQEDAFKEDALARRCNLPAEIFEYNATMEDRALNDNDDTIMRIVLDDECRELLTLDPNLFKVYGPREKELDFSNFIEEDMELPSPIEPSLE